MTTNARNITRAILYTTNLPTVRALDIDPDIEAVVMTPVTEAISRATFSATTQAVDRDIEAILFALRAPDNG